MTTPLISLCRFYIDKLGTIDNRDRERVSFYEMKGAIDIINLITRHSYDIQARSDTIKTHAMHTFSMITDTCDKGHEILEIACKDPTPQSITTATISWNTLNTC
jgi:hypothetical protein